MVCFSRRACGGPFWYNVWARAGDTLFLDVGWFMEALVIIRSSVERLQWFDIIAWTICFGLDDLESQCFLFLTCRLLSDLFCDITSLE
jgi:hypothetical protein